jgi:hypothetical protein
MAGPDPAIIRSRDVRRKMAGSGAGHDVAGVGGRE